MWVLKCCCLRQLSGAADYLPDCGVLHRSRKLCNCCCSCHAVAQYEFSFGGPHVRVCAYDLHTCALLLLVHSLCSICLRLNLQLEALYA
jgi:hypothetical protein